MRIITLAFVAAVLCAKPVSAQSIPITNPSFEADFAAPGTFPILTPAGWSVIDPNGILDNSNDAVGVLNPTTPSRKARSPPVRFTSPQDRSISN